MTVIYKVERATPCDTTLSPLIIATTKNNAVEEVALAFFF
jgi:hypothetical protein